MGNNPGKEGGVDLPDRLNLANKNLVRISEDLLHDGCTTIDASFNKISSVSTSLSRLVRLKILKLLENDLAIFPRSVLSVPSLEQLVLDRNRLSVIPDGIEALRNLKHLSISCNHIKELPSSIAALPFLELLDVSSNNLITLPDSIGQLQHLQYFRVSGNNLVVLPVTIGGCISLQVIHLQGNRLTALTQQLALCTALMSLDATRNDLTSVDAYTLASLTRLRQLRLESNKLTSIPDTIGLLTGLKELKLRGNRLRTLPAEMGNLVTLKTLDVAENLLETLPVTVFQNMTTLESLDLSHNRLTEFNSDIQQLRSLTQFWFTNNPFKSLPVAVFHLPLLERIMAFDCDLDTLITEKEYEMSPTLDPQPMSPSQLSSAPGSTVGTPHMSSSLSDSVATDAVESLSSQATPDGKQRVLAVATMSLEEEHVVGNMNMSLMLASAEFTQRTARSNSQISSTQDNDYGVKELYVTCCPRLSKLPRNLPNRNALRVLCLSESGLTDMTFITTSCPSLLRLRLCYNLLTVVPKTLKQLTLLEELALSGNDFGQAMRETALSVIGSLRALRTVHLSECNLGSVPACLGNVSALQYIDLSGNGISEFSSQFIEFWPRLDFLDISDNDLSSLPVGLSACANLREIRADHNHISELPADLSNLESLEVLTLDCNPLCMAVTDLPAVNGLCMLDVKTTPTVMNGVSYVHMSRRFDIAAAVTMGNRPYMEDGIVIHGCLGEMDIDYVAVFDGHAGNELMKFCVTAMHVELLKQLATSTPSDALRTAFANVNEVACLNYEAGSVAVVALIMTDKIVVANCGDCRAVMSSSDGVQRLTRDHKATDAVEARAISARGGYVSDDGRLNAVLAVARSLGDREMMPAVSCEPEISVIHMQPQHEKLILACDGVWDVLTDECVHRIAQSSRSAVSAARRIRNTASLYRSGDNISAVVVDLKCKPKFDSKWIDGSATTAHA